MASESLYRRMLGERFEDLPEVLRRFHDANGGGRAQGMIQVERAGGWLRNTLASLLGLPRAGRDIAVRLEVYVEGDRERWVRWFAHQRVETVQWERDGALIEALGATTFSSALVVVGSCLRYEFRRAWVAGIPLPRRLGPVIDGWVDAGSNGWRVVVRIAAPLLGELVRYEGWVEPEFECALSLIHI